MSNRFIDSQLNAVQGKVQLVGHKAMRMVDVERLSNGVSQ